MGREYQERKGEHGNGVIMWHPFKTKKQQKSAEPISETTAPEEESPYERYGVYDCMGNKGKWGGGNDFLINGITYVIADKSRLERAWVKDGYGWGRGDCDGADLTLDFIVVDRKKYPVIRILSGAFRGCQCLETVTLGEGVEVIDDYAFAECPNLRSVHTSQCVRKIDMMAFADCPKLSDFTTESPRVLEMMRHKDVWDKILIVGNAPTKEERDKCKITQEEYDNTANAYRRMWQSGGWYGGNPNERLAFLEAEKESLKLLNEYEIAHRVSITPSHSDMRDEDDRELFFKYELPNYHARLAKEQREAEIIAETGLPSKFINKEA